MGEVLIGDQVLAELLWVQRQRAREVRLMSRVTPCPHPSQLPHLCPWGLLQLDQSRAPGSPGLWRLPVPPQAVLESELGIT